MTARCQPGEGAQISAERGARAIENDMGYNHFKRASRAPLTDDVSDASAVMSDRSPKGEWTHRCLSSKHQNAAFLWDHTEGVIDGKYCSTTRLCISRGA